MRAQIGVVEFVREASVVHCGDVGVEGMGGVDELEGFGDVGRHESTVRTRLSGHDESWV